LVLTKGVGVGVLSAALKQDRLSAAGYDTLIETTTQLNSVGRELADFAGVHAVTDVTGFGLLGHALEMCRGAGLAARIFADMTPVLAGVEALVRTGVRTGASDRNWQSYAGAVSLPPDFATWRRDLLTDPQTSGGLLIAVNGARADALVEFVQSRGFSPAADIGRFSEGPAGIEVI
jgi:selenide,water dikinase